MGQMQIYLTTSDTTVWKCIPTIEGILLSMHIIAAAVILRQYLY